MGIEPMTSSLPRKRSTPELRRPWQILTCYIKKSGRRGSNPRPTAWKAVALPTELLPLLVNSNLISKMVTSFSFYLKLCNVGRGGFEPPKSKDNRFTVCPSWPLWYLPENQFVKELSLEINMQNIAHF